MTSFPLPPPGDPALPLSCAAGQASAVPFLALAFGDETVVNEASLDQRGRRLLRRLEAAGEATLHRTEFTDEAGRSHVLFSYTLHPAPPHPPAGNLARAIDAYCDLYDHLPDAAWRHAPAQAHRHARAA